MSYAVLFQNGCHVGFGYIIDKGAVAENHLGITGRFQFFVPIDNALSKAFHFIMANGFVEASKQHAISDAINGLATDFLLLNGNGQIDTTFQEQFVKHIFFATPFNQVFFVIQKRLIL